MVDKQIVLDTIKKMQNAGLSEAVIVSTLEDVGLKESEINGFLAESRGKTPVSSAPTSAFPTANESAETVEDAGAPFSANQANHQENVLMHTTTQAALETSLNQLQELNQRLFSMEQKIDAVSSLPLAELNAKIVNFDKKISSLASEIADIKAQTTALREVLEKVLDTNRSILQEWQGKK